MIFFLVRTSPGRVTVLLPLSSALLCSTLPKAQMVSPIWKAVFEGDLDAVLAILNGPVDLEEKGQHPDTFPADIQLMFCRSHRGYPACRGRQEWSH